MSENLKRLYKTAAWRKKRAALLDKNPFCVRCREGIGQFDGKRLVLARVADHKIPAVDEKTFWANELQPVCKACHVDKGIEDKAWHRKRKMLAIRHWG